MTIPVFWVNLAGPEISTRGMWDQTMVEDLLSGPEFDHHEWTDSLALGFAGAVFVVPGRFHANPQHYELLNNGARLFEWVLWIVTSDEESLFDIGQLEHPNQDIWRMTPRPLYSLGYTYIGEGYTPLTRSALRNQSTGHEEDRPIDWSFAGQITHQRRREMLNGTSLATPGQIYPTDRFADFEDGLGPDEYYRLMARSKIVLCPAGPATPDSFRAFEALEAGCIPIVDAKCQAFDTKGGYWRALFGNGHPVPEIHDWREVDEYIDLALTDYSERANRVFAWWQEYKRAQKRHLLSTLGRLRGSPLTSEGLAGRVTVLMPTSPTPDHPDTSIIQVTYDSIRAQLPDAEIIVMIDGVREEQADRFEQYQQYQQRLLWLTNHVWHNVTPIRFDEHQHQALCTKAALELVDTDWVLFVEHDTPIEGEIPWQDLVDQDDYSIIRFSHESQVLPPHEHLMVDRMTLPLGDLANPNWDATLRFRRTVQWSQRPHLARTDLYRSIITTYFGEKSRTMIEDVMHGVLQEEWRNHGMDGWRKFGLAIYSPPGNIRRSYHLDARKDDPKFDMVFEYDGPTPFGAPAPMSGRVD